jgi:hydroxyacylglutathione hydrolase
MATWIADGWCLVGRYGPLQTGCWVLTHGGEAVIVETPPSMGDEDPARDAAALLRDIGAHPLHLLFTHNHWDHTLGFSGFREALPRVPTLVHASFPQERWQGPFDQVFPEPHRTLWLGGEPLHLLHAPKHSWHDVLVFFRGVALVGDWSLGPYPDCNLDVPPRAKLDTLARTKRFLAEARYHVHTTVSAHGDEIRRGVDFVGLLDEMYAFWAGRDGRE